MSYYLQGAMWFLLSSQRKARVDPVPAGVYLRPSAREWESAY